MAKEEDHFQNLVAGILLGAFVGGGLGLGACVYIFDTMLFPGDTILFGAIICGGLGFYYGEGFIEWLKENWWWFS